MGYNIDRDMLLGYAIVLQDEYDPKHPIWGPSDMQLPDSDFVFGILDSEPDVPADDRQFAEALEKAVPEQFEGSSEVLEKYLQDVEGPVRALARKQSAAVRIVLDPDRFPRLKVSKQLIITFI